MDITLEFKFRVGGNLTAATSVVLSDATDTYGVKRLDTDAVVVANNTAMTTDIPGIYRYTFTPPASGLTYSWVAEVVYAGATYRFEQEYADPAPSTGYLTTLARLKSYLGITVSTFDTQLTTFLASATAAIEAYCDRHLISAERTEKYDGRCSAFLGLRGYPVTEIDTLAVNDEDVAEQTDDAYGYEYDPDMGTIYYGFPRGFRNVEVTYTSGYTVIPEDLQQATCVLAAAMYRMSSRDTSLKSEQMGDYEYVNYGDGQAYATLAGTLNGIAPEAVLLLKFYRRVHAL